MSSFALIFAATALAIFGDYFIKTASNQPNGLLTARFLLGALLYGLPAVAWFFLMRSHSLAATSVFYSASTIILLTAMGVMVFKESFGPRHALGIALALGSVAVMSSRD